MKRSFFVWVAGISFFAFGLFQLFQPAPPVQAADLSIRAEIDGREQEDFACILCHQDTTAEIEFSSGETIPALVNPDIIAHSTHGTLDEPLACTSCHNANTYRIPHDAVTAPDYRSYQLQQNGSCENCHAAPHLTSHPQEEMENGVACIDCHGGHDVQPANTWQSGTGVEKCAACHENVDGPPTETAILTMMITNGLFAQQVDSNYCIACHNQPDLTMTFANGETESVFIDIAAFEDSVHGADNSWEPLSCANCHELEPYPHEPIPSDSIREYTLKRYTVCQQCHEQNYEQAEDSVHGTAIAEGNADAAVCTDCHGAHDTPVPNEPRERISHTCEQCHSEIYNEYATSIHGSVLLGEDNEDVPTCIECHGVHNINDPTTTQARNRSPELCAGCHADAELMDKYEISTDVFETYVADFHGTTVTLFEDLSPDVETNKAVCYDCHGVHNILAPDDPHAGIKGNLLVTCQQCHPDATANFPDAWTSHFPPSLDNNPLVYLVNLFYQIVIPFTLSFFVLMVGTDIYRRVRERFGRKAE